MTPRFVNMLAHAHLPLWAMLLILAVHLAAGIGLGLLYFGSVWWNARQFAAGGHTLTTLAAMAGRFVLLGGLMVLASFEGALPLLLMALGVLIARPMVVRRVRRMA